MVFEVLRDAFLSFFVAAGFAFLFETPLKAIPVAGVLGGMGHCLRFVLLSFGGDLVLSTLCGAVLIGLSGMVLAHLIHTPPVVFTLPACITMIPGLFAYRTMMSGIRIYEAGPMADNSGLLQQAAYNFILTAALLFCLAIGICIAALLFRRRSIKYIRKVRDIYRKQVDG